MQDRSTIAGALLASCIAVTPLAASAEEFQYATYFPGTHPVVANTEKLSADLSAMTEGAISLVIQSGGSIVSGKATLSAISDLLVDSGLVTDIYVPGDLPHAGIASGMALAGENPWVMAGAMLEYAELACNGCQSDLDKLNVINLGYHSTDVYKLLCKPEVRGFDDLAGLKIRASGPWTRLVASWGASPVNVPGNDMYEGMQRGQLDCVVVPESVMNDFALAELVTTVVDVPMGTYHGYHSFVVNKDRWEGLDDTTRAAFIELMPAFLARNVEIALQSSAESREAVLAQGATYVEADEAMKASLAENKIALEAVVIENAAKRGIENPEAYLARFLEIVDKWSGLIGDEPQTVDGFAALLKEHVFDQATF